MNVYYFAVWVKAVTLEIPNIAAVERSRFVSPSRGVQAAARARPGPAANRIVKNLSPVAP
jgi:hypothetical protein